MSGNYVDTPSTEQVDATTLSHAGPVDFSFVQPFASPSKRPGENLRDQMRGLRGTGVQQQIRTPRARNPLLDKRNPQAVGKPEFTPLLKSASRNRLIQQSLLEEKENTIGLPDATTPQGLRSSFAAAQTPRLPFNDSMIDGDHTVSSNEPTGDATPLGQQQSSSMLDSTDMPELRKRSQGRILDQGNALTLRDQEAKLDEFSKENFALKLRIHYMEEALRKTGSEHVKQTLQENINLQTERGTLAAELKKAHRRLKQAEEEMEQYRIEYTECAEKVKTRHANERDLEEIERLSHMAKESQQLADEREQELQDVKRKLDEGRLAEPNETGLQELRDSVQDLEAELRNKQREIDGKDDQIESLQERLEIAEAGAREIEHQKEDIEELETELEQKDRELDEKDAKIVELEETVNAMNDEEKSSRKLRSYVSQLEAEVREKTEVLEEKSLDVEALGKRLQALEAEKASEIRQRDHDLDEMEHRLESKNEEMKSIQQQQYHDLNELEQQLQSKNEELKSLKQQRDHEVAGLERELGSKAGELNSYKERLNTARGSWDDEAQRTDARFQEKDQLILEKDAALREKSNVVQQRDNDIARLQRRLHDLEDGKDQLSRRQTHEMSQQSDQIRELQEKLRAARASSTAKLNEKDGLIRSREDELRILQNRVSSLTAGENAEIRQKSEQLRELEVALREKEALATDQAQQMMSLRSRIGVMETPSKKDSFIRQLSDKNSELQREIARAKREKDVELDEMDQALEKIENENAKLRIRVNELQDSMRNADRDHSALGHHENELKEKAREIHGLQQQLEDLQSRLQDAVLQRQDAVRDVQRELDHVRREALMSQETTREQQDAKHRGELQNLEDEIVVLESQLDAAVSEKDALEARMQEMETSATRLRENDTVSRERDELQFKLEGAEAISKNLKQQVTKHEVSAARLQNKVEDLEARLKTLGDIEVDLKDQVNQAECKHKGLQNRIDELQQDLVLAQQDHTLGTERQDLHDLLRKAKFEAEDLQIKLSEREKKASLSSRREAELKGRLHAVEAELEDAHTVASQLETRLSASLEKEKDLRSQIRDLGDAKRQLQELEQQLGDRQGSSSGHARREVEFRTKLRETRSAMETLRMEMEEKEEHLNAALSKQRILHDRLKQARLDGTLTIQGRVSNGRDLQSQLDDADIELATLQQQLLERDSRLQASLQREEDFRMKLKAGRRSSQSLQQNNQLIKVNNDQAARLETLNRRHQAELRGLAKQITYLRASVRREESFRKGLVFTKAFFLKQVETYNRCNNAQLDLLQDMGLTPIPEASFGNEKARSLKPVIWAVRGTIRMRRGAKEWGKEQKIRESLLKKLEGIKKKQQIAA